MSKIIVICNDLIFKTKIDLILKSQNKSATMFSDFNFIDLKSNLNSSLLIIVDLEIPNIDFSFITKKKKFFQNKIYLLGYCSHVLTNLMHKANDAGFDKVMPRSKFINTLPDFLNNFDKLLK